MLAPIIHEIARPTQFPSASSTTSVVARASPLHRRKAPNRTGDPRPDSLCYGQRLVIIKIKVQNEHWGPFGVSGKWTQTIFIIGGRKA